MGNVRNRGRRIKKKTENLTRYKYQFTFPASGYVDGKIVFRDKEKAKAYVQKQKGLYPHLKHYLIEFELEEK